MTKCVCVYYIIIKSGTKYLKGEGNKKVVL